MPVAHQPPPAIIGKLVGMAAEQARSLGLDGLCQKGSRAVAQNLGQRIGKSSWLRELENVSLGHGVSLLRWRSGGVEHPHDTPPYPFTPSPTFDLSSVRFRSPVTSRSNWAKESRTFSVSRPMLVVVLNCWVIDTNETPRRSKTSTSLAKSASALARGRQRQAWAQAPSRHRF